MFTLSWSRLPWRGAEVLAAWEQAGSDAARAAAEYVAERARAYCPVDTGVLRASIEVRGTMGGLLWHVVATAPYAAAVEFGSLHGDVWIAPNPFLRRAMDDGRREYPKLLSAAFVTAARGKHLGVSFRALAA